MSAPPILILADTLSIARRIAQEDSQGEPPLVFVTWDEFDSVLRSHSSISAVICQAGDELQARKGLLEMLRRAYPEAPVLTFSEGESAAVLERSLDRVFDSRLLAPMSAFNLRTLVYREARLLSMSRRYRQALGRIRDQADKLDLLIQTAKAANSLLEPKLVMQLLMSRILDLIHAESWSLYLIREASEGVEVDVLRGDRTGKIQSYRLGQDSGVPERVLSSQTPELLVYAPLEDRRDALRGAEEGAARRPVISVPLFSRGKIIGKAELCGSEEEGEGEGRFGEKEVELVRLLMEPAAVTIENAILFKRLEELSVTDDLTMLYNSRYLQSCLDREMKRARRYRQSVSVIFLDLDGFKNINDQFGHISGSRTLAELGRLLTGSLRDTDIVSRYGGDEFTIVMPHTSPRDAFITAERVRRTIEEHVFLSSSGLSVRITASFGVASFPEHGETREELISHADRAMYSVKQRGKNGVEIAALPAESHCS